MDKVRGTILLYRLLRKTNLLAVRRWAFMPIALFVLNACGGSSFNGLENNVSSACAITNTSPTSTSFKVSGIAGTITHFTAGLSDVTCLVAYTVNGIPVTSTGSSLDFDSANFVAGKNTVTAISGLSTTSWTVYKNSPPVCSSYVPATSGSNIGVGASLAFSANATDADQDPLTFSFQVNGESELSSVLTTSSTSNSGHATFNPDSTFLGANTISMLVGDGTDVTTCSWSVEVNGACSIASESPSNASSVRVASANGTLTPFTVNGSGGCAVFTWSLNGITISGATNGTYNLPSSTLQAGNNTLVASASNGSSSPVTTTWTVIKNTPPVCSSQTPAATGNATGAGMSITLIGDATDSSGNPLTFSWKDNGNVVDPNFFQVTSGVNSTQAVFSPDNTFVGSNSISALISDGLDTASCSWTVQVSPACQLVSSAPSTTTYKMAFAPATTQVFAATSNDPSCIPVWSLNGTVIPGATSALVSILSSQLNNGPATNTLQVTYSNGSTSAQRSWTISKNQPPTCASQNPAASGQSLGVGASLLFAGTAGNPDGDPLSFNWTMNNASISTLILNPANSGNVGKANFTPTAAQIGNVLLTMNVSDGYDSASCNWTVGVNSACAIGSVTPTNVGSIRVANSGTTSTGFQANATGCNSYVWSLNGSPISGATAANLNVLSSQLLAGANSLQVSATNGTSTDSKTWTVIKNTPPTCSGQTPTATGSTVGVGSPLVLTANGSDSNGNPLTFAWADNGASVNSSFFTISGAGSSSQASFVPDSTFIGNNNISAAISDGYDTTSCAWNVQVLTSCSISTSAPSTSTYKVPQLGTTANQFVATANDSSCSVIWKLNGTAISGATTSVLSLTSAQLYDAPNTNSVQAVYSNGSSSATRTWTVTKNQPSTCATQSPAATGNSLGAGANLGFNLTASNPDSDTISYSWLLNNVNVSTSILNPTSSGTTSQATFYPTSGYVGPNIVTALINDGYDTTSCNWNVNVNGSCAISSTTPLNTASTRVSSVGTTATNFQAVTSPGCSNYTWALNGSTISGATGSTYSVLSSNLSTGNNTLTATVTNGTSSDSKSWTVVKNSPPTCSSQTPAATGNSLSVGSTLTFAANGSDPNSLPLTYSWANNGTAVNGAFFTVTNSGGNSQAVFAPNASFVGNNTLVATISDGYDQASCSWSVAVAPSCQIASSSPSTTTFKVPYLSTSSQAFVASANDPSCVVTWSLNGSTVSGATTSLLNLTSSQLNAGPSTNTVTATYANGSSTATRSWTVTKNQPPTCATQTPATTGSSLGTGSNLVFSATAGNPDSDTMSYVWSINNGSVSTSILNPSNSGNNASATFYPTSAFVGPNLVTATLFDGYDQTTCNWNVTVNGSCAIGTTTPTAGTSVRVANASATNTSFTAPTSPACSNYVWSLNGTAISGATGSTAQVSSSLLSTGNNTLQVSVTNGTSSDSKTWTVVKNTPPVCSSQTPAATNNSVGVSGNLTLVANGTDANPISFTWQNNGAAANASYFAITNGTGTSQAVFTPDATLIGSNSISAILNDGYDSTTCNWAVQVYPQCSIASAFPSSTTVKVPFVATTSNSFVASANDPSCAVTWSLNGTTVAGATTSALTLTSSQLNAGPGTNTVTATYANGSSSATRTWTVTKNQPPTCATQTPAASGNSLGTGSTITFNETAGNPDADTLSYVWTLNNSSVSTSILNPSNSGNTGSAIFFPSSLYVGPNIVTSTISDGYDTASCNWNVTVNGNCAIASTTPTTATPLRVANTGSTATNFSAATSASCANYTWTLNGTAISGATNSSYSVLSSALSTGNNTLQVAVTNGTSSATQSWTVVKNSPPVCSSQTPTATGTTVGVGSTQNFVAGATDANGDALNFTWTDNGSPVNASYFTITNGSGTSQAAFAPNASFVGANTLSAVISDGYDTTSCNWSLNVLPQCAVLSSSPSTTTSKISYAAATSNSFVTVVNDSSCTPTWTLNGTAVSGATNPVLALASSQFLDGPSTNTLVATYTNGSSTATRSWTVTKNQPPTCATQSPTPSNNSLGVGSNISFMGTAGNPDSDSLTYAWAINNASVSNAILNPTASGNSSTAIFYPTSTYLGANVVSMNVSDGYDSATCNWSVTVNPSCQFLTSTPAASTSMRVAANGSTSTTFATTASTGCTQFTWTLNGAAISGATGSNYAVPSSNLSTGNNTLSVSVTNGTSSASQSWTVVKNSPPVCSSQTPGATGNTLGSGQTLTLGANGSDANSDPLTFTWQNNGNAVASPYFTITNGSGTSQAVFAPDATLVGSNAVTATISDGYDTTSCAWAVNVKPLCTIASSSPSTTTYKVPFLGTASQTYVATANDSSCTPTWTLNGATLSGQTSASVTLSSSQLNAGPATNALVATYTNGSTTATRTWTITKNQLSTCATQAPAVTGNSIGVGGNETFSATAGNPDSDTLSYNWYWNGSALSTAILNPTSAGNSTSAVFTPTTAQVGASNTASVTMSDGYDNVSCSWAVAVANSCAISGALPSTTTYKTAFAPSTSNLFFANYDTSCTPTWTLNGSTISTSNAYVSILSSALSSGPATNNVTLSITNGTSTTTRSWVVTKNQVPVCSSIVPATTTPTPMAYNITKPFTANVSDADGDALSGFAWTFNGASASSIFTNITSTANSSSTTFAPTFAQVGTGQVVGFNFTDGYDSQSCQWTLNILNPNTVSMTSCNPVASPVVVYSAGTNSTQTLQMIASNASSYQWFKGGSAVTGSTNSSLVLATGSYPTGTYSFQGTAYDSLNNAASCPYTVKFNAPPVIGSSTPLASQTWKMNIGSTLGFNVAATDANNDTLIYTWTLDGATNAALSSGSASAVLNPNYNYTLVGAHTVSVTVSDGYESVSQTWSVQINLFSQVCDNLWNGTVATTGGQVCTLVGVPGIGSGLVPSADQTKIRIHPNYVIDDGSGNWFITDTISNAVQFSNRSASPITRFGMTMAPGTMTTIIGDGAAGVSADNLYNNNYKLNTPQGIAFDSATGNLFIADYSNHRVAMMSNTGFTTTVLGVTGGGSNVTAENTDGQVGTNSICNNPTDVHIVNYGGARWLYASCYGTNTIKRLDILPTSGTYLDAYTVVGATTTGVTAAGVTDGATGLTGTATTNGPWALADDGQGNIYWTEYSSFRVKVAAMGGSNLTFFGGLGNNTGSTTITAADTSAALTAGTGVLLPSAISSTISKLNIVGPAATVISGCVPYRVQAWNATNTVTNVSGATAVVMTGTGAGSFYTDSGCTVNTGFSIANGASETTIYFKSTSATSTTLTATAGAYTGTLAVTVAATGTATKLAVIVPANFDYTTCTKLTVQAQNASNVPSTLTAAKTIRMSNNAVGNFFTTSNCSGTPTNVFSMASGTTELPVYFATTMIAPAYQTATLLGSQTTNSTLPSTNTAIPVGSVYLRQPRGIAIATSGSNVTGIYVSQYDQERITYYNNTASSTTIGGDVIPGYYAGVVAGTGTAGFNTDQIGDVSRIYTAYGISLAANNNSLLVADYDNYRVRALDLTTGSGILTTYMGVGYGRSGNLGDSPIAATAMYLNTPGEAVIDNTNNLLYVSDSANGRVRRVNLLTGYVDTIIGEGVGAGTTENVTPTNVYMNSPRGLVLMSNSSQNFLLYADQAANTAVNSDCQIRALNLTPALGNPSPTATSLFGVSINPNSVATIAGDYGLGCEPWNTAPVNTSGGTATANKIYNPEGIATDGTNLLIADYNDHCILKLLPNGTTSPVIGTCGTSGATDGSTAVALIRLPTGIVMDPLNPSSGNFFFADNVDQTSTRVRYVNYLTTTVQIGSVTVPAATSPNGIVTTIWIVSPSGNSQGQIFGLAAFGTQLCMAGGSPTSGVTGTHNVTCYNRSNALGPVTLRIGPNETSAPPIRGGAPLNNTIEEGVTGANVLLNAPYGLTFDSAGNLYIVERANHMIRMVSRWF